MRATPALRRLIQETTLNTRQIVAPLFVTLSGKKRQPIPSMPGIFRLSISEAVKESRELSSMGIGALLLFGIPARKDPRGSGAYAENGVIQQALKAIKRAVPGLVVITDVCLCEYTSHGHCGILGTLHKGTHYTARVSQNGASPGVDNDATLELLGEIALSQAKAGADIVAPSAMMDGQVGAIREVLDRGGFKKTPIMSYSAKYASGLYGPFREAVGSTPQFGDRRGYQMDPPNVEEALREVALDIAEGADIVMVKPASLYLDVVRKVKETFHWPTAAYQVSGEYSLIKAAAAKGWIEEKRIVVESALAMRRSGADILITYYAKELAHWIQERGR
jgi:porphobilinogen synthase